MICSVAVPNSEEHNQAVGFTKQFIHVGGCFVTQQKASQQKGFICMSPKVGVGQGRTLSLRNNLSTKLLAQVDIYQ
jgi:hypothetical protein